jgi:hypothetical protein
MPIWQAKIHHFKFLVLPRGMAKPDIRYSLFNHPSKHPLFRLDFLLDKCTINPAKDRR